jgi:cysteine-rich repeat protein
MQNPAKGYCEAYIPVCGDGLKDVSEECDDGNTQSGDGCDASCKIEAGTCGTGDTQGMVSYWNFDNSSNPGKDNVDGNDGTVNGATSGQIGQVGDALGFDGTNNVVTFPNPSSLNFGSSDLTIAMWVKPYSTSSYHALIQMDPHFGLYLRMTDDKPQLLISRDCSGWYPSWNAFTGTSAFTANQWHYVVLTRQGDMFKVIVNGVTSITASVSGTICYDPTKINGIGLEANTAGSFASGTAWPFNGLIDEVAIYNRSLTATEIQQHYQKGLANKSYCGAETAPAGISTWDAMSRPEGIYEPTNTTDLSGTHLYTFVINFSGVYANISDVLSCNIQTANGVINVSRTITEQLVNQPANITFTIPASYNSRIDKIKLWKIIACGTKPATGTIYTHLNSWSQFNSVDDDAYRALDCWLGFRGRYFNNTEICSYEGDVAFAVSMAKGLSVEGYCHDTCDYNNNNGPIPKCDVAIPGQACCTTSGEVDNDGNGQANCNDRYCQGIPYECAVHTPISG